MKDSGIAWIGQIPEKWEIVRFKYLHNTANTGESIDKELCSTDQQGKLFYTAGLKPIYTSYEEFPEWKYTNDEDLLLARNGSPYIYLPKIKAVYSDHIIRVDIKNGYAKRFIRYCLQNSISAEIVDSVSLATWSISLWNKQVLPLPSHSEQTRIADFLDKKCAAIDSVLEKTKASIEEYKKLKQSIITEAVTGKVRIERPLQSAKADSSPNFLGAHLKNFPQEVGGSGFGEAKDERGLINRPMKDSGVEWIGQIPEDWAKIKLSYISLMIGDGLHGTPIFDDTGKVYFINGNNLGKKNIEIKSNTKTVSFEEASKYNVLLNNNTILISLNGTIGNISYYNGENIILGKSAGYIVLQNNVCKEYIAYYLQSNSTKILFELSLSGTTIGNLSLETLRNIPVLEPPIAEQQAIADYLDKKCAEIDNIISKKEKLLTELEAYKKSLIYEYVTGKRRVEN